MSNGIAERVDQLIDTLGIRKVEFARAINVDQSFISQVTSGKRNPSDRTISDICREFAVNEEWLRTGEGEMFADIDRHKKIAAFLGDLMREDDSNFRVRMIEMLSELSPDEWALLEKLAKRLTSEE